MQKKTEKHEWNGDNKKVIETNKIDTLEWDLMVRARAYCATHSRNFVEIQHIKVAACIEFF